TGMSPVALAPNPPLLLDEAPVPPLPPTSTAWTLVTPLGTVNACWSPVKLNVLLAAWAPPAPSARNATTGSAAIAAHAPRERRTEVPIRARPYDPGGRESSERRDDLDSVAMRRGVRVCVALGAAIAAIAAAGAGLAAGKGAAQKDLANGCFS